MRKALLIAAGLAAGMLGAGAALAMQDAGALRAAGQAAERADGYLAATSAASGQVRSQVEAINIQRRAAYTQLAQQRGATIEEVAAATACQIFANRIAPGQHYMLEDGVDRTRNGSEAVPLPRHCR